MTWRLGVSLTALFAILMAVFVFEFAKLWPAVKLMADPQRAGRIYYLPSESMLPTLAVNDRVAPLKLDEAGLHRGDVVVFDRAGQARVDRVIGLPGNRVAVRAGIVTINGQCAAVRSVGAGPAFDDAPSTRLQIERLPGEAQSHFILDAGPSEMDEAAETTVPPGMVFVLGDNRDRAADSRFPREEGGVGMVPIGDVIGRITATVWSSRSRRFGEPIDSISLTVARRRS